MLNQSFAKSEVHEKDLIYFLITEGVAINNKEIFRVLARGNLFMILCILNIHCGTSS